MTTFSGPALSETSGVGALTFGGFLDEVAGCYGDQEALMSSPAGGSRVSWTYAQLRNEARALAKALVAAGVTKGTRVGVLMGGRPEWVAATFGAAMAGGVAVMLNTFATARELGYLLANADVGVVIAESHLLNHRYVDDVLELCPEARTCAPGAIYSDAYPFLRHIVALDADVPPARGVHTWDAFIAGGSSVPDAVIDAIGRETVPTDDAAIIYSSGTTSVPKGMLHHHRAAMLQSWLHGEREGQTPHDRVFTAFPLFWTAGFAFVLGATLASGGCFVMTPYFDAEDTLRLIEKERITLLQLWPHQIAAVRERQEAQPRDLTSVRRDRFRLTGETVPDDLASLPDRQGFGMSETFTYVTAVRFDGSRQDRETNGSVLPGTDVRIVDPVTGDTLDVGQEGEIVVKGAALMKCYVKVDPTHCFDEDGYYHTGDAGWFDDRRMLHWTGRLKVMIRTAGVNVSPLEVEEQLLAHRDINEAVVVGIPDPTLGEVVVACAVPRADTAPTADEVRRFLRRSLSNYKVPRHVLFFAADDLPRTASDKFDLSAVRSLAAESITQADHLYNSA